MKKIFAIILIAACLSVMAGCAHSNTAHNSSRTNDIVNSGHVQSPDTALSKSNVSIDEPAVVADAIKTENNTPVKSATVIGEDAAKAIALEHAGLAEKDVTFILAHPDRDDGRTVYDVEFYVDMKEYDYEIDAYSGNIISCDFDIENYTTASHPSNGSVAPPQSNTTITLEKAKAIALEKAGVSQSDATFTETSFEYDDGIPVYQIDFISGTLEYEVEINANTGAVIEYDVESIYD